MSKNTFSEKKSLLYGMFIVLYIALLVDVCISNVADIEPIASFHTSWSGIIVFSTIGIIFIGCHFVILRHKFIPTEIGVPILGKITIHHFIRTIQLFICLILAAVILQTISHVSYDTFELILTTLLSYGTASILLALLSYKLLKWFFASKSTITFIFGIAVSLIAINAFTSLLLFTEVIYINWDHVVNPSAKGEWRLPSDSDDIMQNINEIQFISMVGYFIMTYIGTILLLIHHAKRIGIIKFWVLIISPLIIFVYNYPTLFKYVLPNAPDLIWHPPELIPLIIVYTLSIALLGLVIGIGFYSVAKSITQNKLLKSSLMITAIGFIFYFNSGDATVLHVPYPPYGLPNVGFVGLASFLIFAGLFNTARSVSRDINLRNIIKKSLSQDSKFLSSMGNAQLRNELEQNIMEITSKSSSESDNLYPTLSVEEARMYVNEVLDEIKSSKLR